MATSPNDCCWIILATTGCSTDNVSKTPTMLTQPKVAADCCWILVATTGCSVDAASGNNVAASAPQNLDSSCCWVIVATTGCTTK